MNDDVELYRPDPTDSWVSIIGPVGELAAKLARTQFVPKALQGNPAGVAAAILTGRELGMGPMTSLRGIDIIEQRPSLTSQMIAARILAAGHRITWLASTDERATVKIERGDGLAEAEATWTMRDAQRAGLAGKKVWQSYPRAMLRHRALTEAAAMACPDIILGLEAADIEPDTGPQRGPTTVVQVSAGPDPTPKPGDAEAGEPAATTPTLEPDPDPQPELITAPQMRHIGALIGRWQQREQRTLDPVERRRFIAWLAGIDPPDSLETAKKLTRAQASTAIDALTGDLKEGEGSERPQPDRTGDLGQPELSPR